ncbi:uncharacterized protein MELLADRAFT_54433 [Melampsora larici-populina 98AG31]|uniref:Uncharacterized protein n=1 Tax=Melampsora larici-populina (strain 98AG31 / pathotype 3-4-7) TaxID=747676 RepID=F4R3K1_MELLP|nr:uncharacterized protein MELLADRAFT_54433 [Melampsora larici-populina 98AG31]EGG13154.1 hypothetical protein MELLADRAFT_54433 [Melampsora larici-populina 98AG31]
MLENLVYHCVEDWKLVEEAFSLIYEHAYHLGVLLTCLDECIFDYPHSQTVELGQVWWRDTDGDWTETRVKDSLEQVSYNIASDRKMGEWVHLSEEVIKTSICEIMGLKESEVDQCKKWCAAL